MPPTGTLGAILADTRRRLAATLDRAAPPDADRAAGPDAVKPVHRPRRRLSDALQGSTVSVVAELKRRSPSKGELNAALRAGERAAAFERGGAAAISILTEPTRFGGDPRDLEEAAAATSLPLLRKDFHLAVEQLREAQAMGASAVLLIARALPPAELHAMHGAATEIGLECLVEVRTEGELAVALDAGAAIIGVNSRDLETLEIDPSVPERLLPRIPSGIVAVWESHVRSRDDVVHAARCGADAVLVGSALSLAHSPEQLIRELAGVDRRGRG